VVKIRYPIPSDPYLEIPTICGLHIPAELSSSGFEFHAVYYWYDPSFPLFWDWATPCAYDPDNQPDVYTVTDSMIGMAQLLFANPALMSDICPYCHAPRRIPRRLRFNIIRNGQYFYGVPACAGAYPDVYTWTNREAPLTWRDGGP